MGACMSAFGRALTLLLKEGKDEGEERNNLPLMELIGDAVRLIADLHHEESESRQNLISLNLDKSLRDMLNNTSLDGWLFGDNLSDRLKTAKAIEKSGEELKTRKKKVGKVTKNWKYPPRRISGLGGQKVQTVQKVQGRRGAKPYRQGSSRGLHPPRHYSVASRGKGKRRER
ncbi:hypothetical protein NQ314_005196 [Rhamnusium bicolor]|uniref:Uncharacterized protein n=1 Tax=Rhamnusium bicolor TaxID=1586634 RepID=A0AAV8ZJF1_9CUCU|nr:hypothetical protein NQ314_005196 [Rhamnusium bicolor]